MSIEPNVDGNPFVGRDVAVYPFPALGDTTIYLRLAQSLVDAGVRVTLYSELLAPAADLLPWLAVATPPKPDIGRIFIDHELVIADILAPRIASILAQSAPENFIQVTAKDMPGNFAPPAAPTILEGISKSDGKAIHRAFCPGIRYGNSMVFWVDRYVEEALGLKAPSVPPPITMPQGWRGDSEAHCRILLFPTTPNPSKNYPLTGFLKLSEMLTARGWHPEVICMPHELEEIRRVFPSEMIRTFPSLRELILHIADSHAVISNDSGGGHLGSMLGLRTFTITKKAPDFVWRPGFSSDNLVASPIMTLKWFSGRIWRPFIPLGRIVAALGKPDVS